MVKITNQEIREKLGTISSEVLNGLNYNRKHFARNIMNYPAMMVPSVQEPIIKSLAETIEGDVSLFDPFMGASNTLVTGMKNGMSVFGQDINPLSLLISQVKTNYYSLEELEYAEKSIIEKINDDSSTKREVQFNNIDKWFKLPVQQELSRLYRSIQREPNIKIRKFYWVTLAEVIRLTSNDRTSTFKMHIRSDEDILNRNLSPISTFKSIFKRSIRDINDYCTLLSQNGLIDSGQYKKEAEVIWGDSMKSINTDKSFEMLVSSPPYGDNQTTVTYGQFSFLPLQWIPKTDIDDKININYLNKIQEIDSKSIGGRMSHNFHEIQEALFETSETLVLLFDLFDIAEKKKAMKVINFFHDLDKSLDIALTKLKPGAFMVWTMGNRSVNKRVVRNDLILTELLKSKSIELIANLDRDILSKRMPGRNNFSDTMSREKILIFKTPLSK